MPNKYKQADQAWNMTTLTETYSLYNQVTILKRLFESHKLISFEYAQLLRIRALGTNKEEPRRSCDSVMHILIPGGQASNTMGKSRGM